MTVTVKADSEVSQPSLEEAIVAARVFRDSIAAVYQAAEDFVNRAETAANDAENASQAVQTVLGSVAGGTLTAFSSDWLLSADAIAARPKIGLPADVTKIPILDAGGKLSTAVLPSLALVETFPVGSQAAMLALNAQPGDVAIRSDISQTFILSATPATTLANWLTVLTPTGSIASVAGLTGTITATALKSALGITAADITNASANGRSLIIAADYAAMKTLLAITAADITNASANGRSLLTAADYAAMKSLLAIVTANIGDMSANGRSLVQAADYAAMKSLLNISEAASMTAVGTAIVQSATYSAVKTLLAIVASDITDASANGRSLIQAANYAAMKTLLAISAADITDASANGRSLIQAANYAAMKTLLAISAADVSGLTVYERLDVEDQVITGGARVTSKDIGAISSGTKTLDPGDRPLQHYTNNGAHTLAPGANGGSILLDIINGSGAGVVTTSGFTKVSGDAFTTTVGHKFRCHISVGNAGSLLSVQAMQ